MISCYLVFLLSQTGTNCTSGKKSKDDCRIIIQWTENVNAFDSLLQYMEFRDTIELNYEQYVTKGGQHIVTYCSLCAQNNLAAVAVAAYTWAIVAMWQ